MFEFDVLLNAFVTLFVTIDPIGLAPLFLGLTDGMTRRQRFSVGLRACIIAFCLLTLFLFAGNAILDKLGITIHAFRVAGGLLLFFIAFEMVFGRRQERKEKSSREAITKDDIANIAVFPLALPLIAGPGAISAAVLLSTQEGGTLEWQLVLTLVILVIVLLSLLSFIAAGAIDRFLGYTGRMILTRLLGVLLAALSVQFRCRWTKSLVEYLKRGLETEPAHLQMHPADSRKKQSTKAAYLPGRSTCISLPPYPWTLSCALTVTWLIPSGTVALPGPCERLFIDMGMEENPLAVNGFHPARPLPRHQHSDPIRCQRASRLRRTEIHCRIPKLQHLSHPLRLLLQIAQIENRIPAIAIIRQVTSITPVKSTKFRMKHLKKDQSSR